MTARGHFFLKKKECRGVGTNRIRGGGGQGWGVKEGGRGGRGGGGEGGGEH